MSRLADSRGFTLIELLLAMTLMLIVMGAALVTFERYVVLNGTNQDLAFDTENARNAMDLLSRDARNATAYQTASNASGTSVLRATDTDFVFKAVDPGSASSATNTYGIGTVRYCLAPSTQRLLRQQRTDAVVPSTACPDTNWTTTATVPSVVNDSRPVFSYDSTDPSRISSVAVDLFLDDTPNRAPVETPLHSGVFLRNTNRPPQAAFTASVQPNGHVRLNGSSSSDPDAGSLTYSWKDGSTVIAQTSPVVDYVVTTTGTHTFTLTVTDRGGLSSTTTQTVTVLS